MIMIIIKIHDTSSAIRNFKIEKQVPASYEQMLLRPCPQKPLMRSIWCQIRFSFFTTSRASAPSWIKSDTFCYPMNSARVRSASSRFSHCLCKKEALLPVLGSFFFRLVIHIRDGSPEGCLPVGLLECGWDLWSVCGLKCICLLREFNEMNFTFQISHLLQRRGDFHFRLFSPEINKILGIVSAHWRNSRNRWDVSVSSIEIRYVSRTRGFRMFLFFSKPFNNHFFCVLFEKSPKRKPFFFDKVVHCTQTHLS